MGNCETIEDKQTQMGKVIQIIIIYSSYCKPHQGLYDYESKEHNNKMIKIKGDAIINKAKNKFTLLPISTTEKKDLKNSLFRIQAKDSYYLVTPISYRTQKETAYKLVWLVINSTPQKCHQLEEGDTLKLGKQKIKVKEIVIQENSKQESGEIQHIKGMTIYENLKHHSHSHKTANELHQSHSSQTLGEKACRICLEPGQVSNPLLAPCKCIGSMKYIHLNCLRQWLGKRLTVNKTSKAIYVKWKGLECEVCKTDFPYTIFLDNQKQYTVDVPKPNKPFIMFEFVEKDSTSKTKTYAYVALQNSDPIIIGRKKEADLRISEDTSISRMHASLHYDSSTKKVHLKDNSSKFGSLVLVRKNLVVRPHISGLKVQIGNQVYQFQSIRASTQQPFTGYELKNTYLNLNVQDKYNESEEGLSSQEIEEFSPRQHSNIEDHPMQHSARQQSLINESPRQQFSRQNENIPQLQLLRNISNVTQ